MTELHVRTLLRSMRRHKAYLFVNVAGLSVGLLCCTLVLLYMQHEFSYDTHFADADQIYRVVTNETGGTGNEHAYATTFSALAPTLLAEVPEVEHVSRLFAPRNPVVSIGDQTFYADRFFYADSSLFDVLSYAFLFGAPQQALTRPYTIALTKTTALRYFGTENPIGQTVQLNNRNVFEVTAVLDDPPTNSHLDFNFLASYATFNDFAPGYVDGNWRSRADYLYVKLRDEGTPEALESILPQLTTTHLQPLSERTGLRYGFEVQPISRVHLYSKREAEIKPGGNPYSVMALGLIALMILVIAAINFVNLSTARAAERAKEIGIRKALGATGSQLTRHFLTESVALTCAAAVVTLPFVYLALPHFNNLAERSLALANVGPVALGVILLGIVAVGLLAGAYPAFILASLRAADALRGGSSTGQGRRTIREALVVVQIVASLVLLFGTKVIYDQLNYMRDLTLGYDKEHVLAVPIRLGRGESFDSEGIKQELLRSPAIQHVSVAGNLPTQPNPRGTFPIRPQGTASTESHPSYLFRVDDDYLSTLGLTLVQGRALNPALLSDSSALLINEAAARQYGLTDPIGKDLYVGPATEPLGQIVGVIEDFYYASVHQPIQPILLARSAAPSFLVIRTTRGHTRTAIDATEHVWSARVAGKPFAYFFLDDAYNALHQAEERLGRIIAVFALIAVVLSCLGLFSLAVYHAKRRTKELSIRKVLGASIPNVLLLLAQDFAKLIALAYVCATPLAYLLMQQWLAHFAYHTPVGADVFILAALLGVAATCLAVSYPTWTAVTRDPMQTLRYD